MIRRRRGWRIAAAAVVTLAVTGPALARQWRAPNPVLEQYLTAYDRYAAGDRAGVRHHLLAAWEADTSDLGPLLEATHHTRAPTAADSVTDAIARLIAGLGDSDLARCLDRLLARIEARALPLRSFAQPEPSAPRNLRLCAVRETQYRTMVLDERPGHIDALRRLTAEYPHSLVLATSLLDRLFDAGRIGEGETFARSLIRSGAHPLLRLVGYAHLPYALHATGRHHEAERVERQGAALALTLGPGAEWVYLTYGSSHARLLRRPEADSLLVAHVQRQIDSVAPRTDQLETLLDPLGGPWGLYGRGLRLLDGGRLDAAVTVFDSLVHLARRDGQDRLLATVLMRRGRALVKLGHTVEAERDLILARETARRSGALHAGFEVEHNLLHLYEALGRDSLVREAGAAFIAQSQLAGHQPQVMMANHDLAWYHQRRGETDRALRFFRAMLTEARTIEGYAYWAGEYFELAGELDSALAYYRRDDSWDWHRRSAAMARMAEALGDVDSAVTWARVYDQAAFTNDFPERVSLLPGLLERLGRFAEAERAYEAAAARAAARGQAAAWAGLAGPLAALRMERGGDPEAAARLADSAAVVAASVAATEARLLAEGVAGLARARQGGRAAAGGLAALRQATRRAEGAALPALAGRMQLMLADALMRLGREDDALRELNRAADHHEAMATTLAADPQRSGFRAGLIGVTDRALAIIMARPGRPGSAERFADWSMRRKGLGILDVAGDRDVVDLAALRRRLPPGAAVVDYAVTMHGTAALVVTGQGAQVVSLAVNRDSLTARVDRLLEQLAPRLGSMVDTARARFDTTLAARLYHDLVAPLLPALNGRTKLIVISDGPLHRLPFDALVAEGGAAPVYVLDRFTVSFAPSLALIGRAGEEREGLAVVAAGPGADAAGVADEVRVVAAALAGRRPVVIAGDSGTEASLRRLAPLAGLLHVAAHARPNDANPAFARLTLAPGGEHDGVLHAFEIERLRLRGALVVLSACETSVGRLAGGEGALSLSRAFLRAGAGGTVATLWPVGAGAAPLMSRFYAELAAGRTAAEALRAAKLAQRGGGGSFAAPLHWAAFTLVSGGW